MGLKTHLEESGSDSGSNDSSDGSSHSSSESDSGSGSASSASDSDHDPVCDEKDEPMEEDQSQNKASPNASDSQDGSSSGGSSKQSRLLHLKEMWEEMPELYGVRRSTRERKEVARFAPRGSEDEEKSRRRGGRRTRRSTDSWRGRSSNDDDDDDESSKSGSSSDDFKPARKSGRRPVQKRRSRQKRKAGRPRRGHADSDDETDSDDDRPARSTGRGRQATKKISYKEDSVGETDSSDLIEVETKPEDVNDAETIEKVFNHRMGRKTATGSKTAMYNCQDHGDPNDGCDPDKEESELQYFIKWKNWSHIHNTWETEESLTTQKVNGLKKLENYKKREEEIREFKKSATPEDIEYFECQQENMESIIEEHMLVDRIITHTANKTENNVFPDYLIKWQGLPYSECTWEDGELVTRKFKEAIDDYNQRNKCQKIPSKYMKALKNRPKFTPLKKQPSYLGSEELVLRDYQLEGVSWLIHAWCKENSAILADEMGLGKTIQTIGFLSYLMNSCQLYGPFLIVVPLSTIVTWQREFRLWAPDINVVIYLGDLSSRNTIRQYEWCHPGNKRLKFNVMITTYEILLKDKSFLGSVSWAVLGIDEAHRLKNDDSLLYKSLVEFDTNHRILITGTPLQNSLKELWSLLHFIMPHKFDDWSEFEKGNKQSEKTGFSGLHKQLEPFLLRRVKKDVEKSLPSKTEQILRVELSSLQKQYYRWILAKNYKALNKGLKGSVSSFINIIMELKKTCNHAFLVRPTEAEGNDVRNLEALVKGSGKLILLDKLLLRLKETGHRVLIFSQMVRMLDILAEYMNLRHFLYQRLDGSIRGDVRKKAMDHFNAEGSTDFCFLLSTRAGGLGLNLASADTVIIFDSDWNPQNDLQAQARAHRIGQKNQVSVYRLVSKYSVEEDIIERAKRKMVLDHLVIQRMDTTGRTVLNKQGLQGPSNSSNTPFNKDELSSILKFGADDLFKEDENEDQDLQVNLDDILQRAETRETEDHMTVGDELLSQFKVVSFDNMESEEIEATKASEPDKDWDQIIPEETRKKIDEEEMQQHILEMNLPPRSRKTVKQFDIYDTDDETGKPKKVKEEETDSSEYSSDDGKPRKRGRPPGKTKEKVKGFNDAEIRRFMKSYRKFGNPWDRLEPIAFDAELQEKSQADLERLAQLLKDGCETAMKEYEDKLKDDPTFDGKKTHRGPSFKIAGVTVNAKAVSNSVNDLSPLAKCLPSDKEERRNYKIGVYVKPVHWDCEWNSNDDSRLLQGIYEHGMGNWEAIKMEPELQLGDKILPDGDTTKPQAKHLQTRADFLLKVLRRNIDGPIFKAEKKPRSRPGGGRKPKKGVVPKSQEIINDPLDDDSSDNQAEKENSEYKKKTPPGSPKKKDKKKGNAENDNAEGKEKKKRERKKKLGKKNSQEAENMEDGEIDDDHEKTRKKKKKKGKSKEGPMHFTANHEPVAVGHEGDFDTDLEQEVFTECKDKMRPVKKVLKKLDNQEAGQSDKDRVQQFTACLLRIGDRISECLSEYNDLEKIKEWRSNLWVFVSKFTEFDAKKLHKWFKHAVHKREGDVPEKKKEPTEKHKSHKEHGPSDTSKRKHEDVTEQKVKERDKEPNRMHKKIHNSSDEASRDSFSSNRDSSRHSAIHSFHNMHNVSRESSLTNSSPAGFQHASPLAYRDSSSSYGQKPGGYGSYGRPPGNFGERGFGSAERPHPHGPGGDHPRHNNDMFRGGYGYHRPDYRGDHTNRDPRLDHNRDPRVEHNRDPRVDHNRDPRVDHNRDPRGEHRKHYQRSEAGNHAPRPPDDRWEDRDRSHQFADRKRRPEDAYGRDPRPAKEAKYHGEQGRYLDTYQHH